MTHDKNSQIEFLLLSLSKKQEFLLLFIDICIFIKKKKFIDICICGLDFGLATFHINWKGD